VHLQREYRRLRSTTLKKLLATTRCGDGRWRGHHSVDPSERRTERTFGSTGPGRAKLERGGFKPRSLWRRNSLRKRLRFARNGGHHRNVRRIGGSCLSDRGSFAGLYSHFWLFFLRKTIETAPRMIKAVCAKFRKQNHPNNNTLLLTWAVFLSHFRPILHDLILYAYLIYALPKKIPVGFFLGTRHVRTFWES